MTKSYDHGRERPTKKATTLSTPNREEPPTTLAQITPESPTFASLQSLSQILHLLHHRSKNQHRRSTWYKHFNLFRRTLSTLLRELSPSPPPAWLPSRKRKLVGEKMRRAEVRVKFVQDVLVGRWWVAFCQVVGDRQFAAVGLVLVAALGSFCASLGLEWEDEGDVLHGVDVDGVLEEFAGGEDGGAGEGDDVGVVIERGEVEDEDGGWDGHSHDRDHDHEPELEVKSFTKTVPKVAKGAKRTTDGSPEPKKKKKSKKRKKGDAIDDLFAGLI